MKYRTAGAFRAALEARLRAAEHSGVGLSRLRKRVVFERLLARLQLVAPDAWLLKGGFALELRLDAAARTTKDIDIDWMLSESDAAALLIEAATARLDDYFAFAIERSPGADDLPGGGQRWTAVATLAGRQFERVAIDIGFGWPVLTPETIASSHLLGFAGIERVDVSAVAIEQHVAEKLHAYTRTYAGNAPSSRIKDLVDLAVIASTTPIDAGQLRRAITDIFERRATHPVPSAVPPPPADWESGWRNLAANVPAHNDLRGGHRSVASFLDPILGGEQRPGQWDPDAGAWHSA